MVRDICGMRDIFFFQFFGEWLSIHHILHVKENHILFVILCKASGIRCIIRIRQDKCKWIAYACQIIECNRSFINRLHFLPGSRACHLQQAFRLCPYLFLIVLLDNGFILSRLQRHRFPRDSGKFRGRKECGIFFPLHIIVFPVIV